MKTAGLLVALLVVGCGGAAHEHGDAAVDAAMPGDGSIPGDGSTKSSDAAQSPPDFGTASGMSAGCNTTPAHPVSYTASTTDGNGTARTYEVLVPSPYDATKPLAVAFVYHGLGESSDSARAYGLQDATGASSAAIFVYPQGIDFMGQGAGWDVLCDGYDVPFFDHMLAELEAQYCIDKSRVFSSGFSMGCDMSTFLMCCRGSQVRAIGAASCSDYFTDLSDYTTFKGSASCPSPLHSGIRFTHDASGGDAGYQSPAFTTTSQLYQHWLACTPSQSAPADSCTTYAGCDEPFVECPYTALGHMLPTGWGADTWSFFDSFASK